MPEVEVKVAGRPYRLVCDEGQEAHLKALASQIDQEARKFAAQSASTGEAQLLLMSALMLADRLHERGDAPGAGVRSDPEMDHQLDRFETLLIRAAE